jgi:hypothetical protein
MQPKVMVVVAGLQKILEQDYPFELIQVQTDNAPEMFNEQLDATEADIYCFMSHRDNFTARSSLGKAVERLLAHDSIGMAYSDYLLNNNGLLSPMYFPAFHPNLLKTDIVINSPLVLRRPKPDLRFNTVLDLLYFYEYLSRAGKRLFPTHIAHPIFTCVSDTSVNLEIELKKLEQCQNQ